MSKFITFTTQDENGCWYAKQAVKLNDIKKVACVPDKYYREGYDHSMLIFNDGSELDVFEKFDEVINILNKYDI
jgi:hypothetical protein